MTMVLRPQDGPQELFLSTSADICIYGGAAGGGKTYGLLLEPLRHIGNPNFNMVVFRRHYTQVTSPGGLWDSARKIYKNIQGAEGKYNPKHHWEFPSGATVNFAYLSRDADCDDWQGSQIALIGFDELTHFTEYQFFYMLSRNRTDSGIAPYVRATCNPEADSWVAKFIEWWIDQDTGYPIPERSGTIRWMTRINEEIKWFSDRESAIADAIDNGESPEGAEQIAKSVTFIASTLEDNKILMEMDPGYLANLKALPVVERERLLKGNWKIKPAAGLFFKRNQIEEFFETIPNDVIKWARGWDLAATPEKDGEPAYTAGVLIGKRKNGKYIVADVVNVRLSAADVRNHIKNTCIMDKKKYKTVTERLPKDPGQAGKEQAESYMKMLAGFNVKTVAESGDKATRAEPFAAQWQAGNVGMLLAEWNDVYLSQLESFPESKFKDMVDASSSAFSEITRGITMSVPAGALEKENYWR